MTAWNLTSKYVRASDSVMISAKKGAMFAEVDISYPMSGIALADALTYIAGNIRRIEGVVS